MGLLANAEVKGLAGNISDGLDGMSTKIIMPAGDIFLFDGLNTDDKGHWYTGITYSTISNDQFVHPKAEMRGQVSDVFNKERDAKRGGMNGGGKSHGLNGKRRIRNAL